MVRALPPNFTMLPLMKPVPFTVSVKAPEPAVALAGCNVVMAGTGLLAATIVKAPAFDVPPPGEGLVTVTDAPPVFAISLARIEAVSRVALT